MRYFFQTDSIDFSFHSFIILIEKIEPEKLYDSWLRFEGSFGTFDTVKQAEKRHFSSFYFGAIVF